MSRLSNNRNKNKIKSNVFKEQEQRNFNMDVIRLITKLLLNKILLNMMLAKQPRLKLNVKWTEKTFVSVIFNLVLIKNKINHCKKVQKLDNLNHQLR